MCSMCFFSVGFFWCLNQKKKKKMREEERWKKLDVEGSSLDIIDLQLNGQNHISNIIH